MTKMEEIGVSSPTIELDIQGKCNKMIDMLTKRDLERRHDIQKEKDDRKNFIAENEKIDFFEQSFKEKYHEIENSLRSAEKLPKKELADHFNNISKDILTLQKYIANSNIFLNTFNIKKFQLKLQELTNKAKDLEEKLIPKKKFGFKNKTKMQTIEDSGYGHSKDIVDSKKIIEVEFSKSNSDIEYEKSNEFTYKSPIINLNENFCGFKNRVGEILELKAGDMIKKDIALTNLEKCTVKLFGAPSTLHMSRLKNCYIFSGPVSTSIFADDCENCTFVIACQQLRLHSSLNINIYLHVTSRAIMEDCKKIYLAPYNLRYMGILNDFKVSGLDFGKNHWDDADDFNWLHIEKQSPNWSLMEDAKIIRNWDHMINAT